MNLQENIQRIKEVMLLDESKKELNRKFKFSNYEETVDFVNKVAKIAEKQNHHPDINFDYNNVEVSITDHEKGGVSDKCHKFMGAVDKLTNKKSETNEDKESGEKWIKCRNCNKKFTQTIHKGKKSLPICPHCGTHNVKEDVIKEENDDTISSDIIIDFERILNKKMPKKFPWWKEIDIQSMGYQPTIFSGMGGIGQTILYGDLFVDEDWARKKWKDLHSSSTVNFPDTNNLEFNDLLGYDEWMELKQYVGKLYNSLTGRNSERISFNRLNIYFDVPQLPKMEQNESEITERCWKGYTQKGMKTMFGKRYPNCVKKKKR